MYATTQYTTVPTGYLQLNEGFPNTVGSSLHPNAPFHTDSLRYKGWGVVYNDVLKDTFLVSTSWVDSNRVTSRWVILPPISGISVNSVLHWKAMAPDPAYADGYAVYISNNISVNDTVIFNNSNKVFQINDNSTSGGGEKSQWTTRSISLSNYAGQSIRIAFKNISKQKYQLWIDDITVENLPYAIDASLENLGNTKYVMANQSFHLKIRLKNNGYQNINNCSLAYSIQGITYNNQSFSLNNALLPINTTTLAFSGNIAINTPGMYQVKIWINQLNGMADQNHFNDTVSYYLSVLNTSVTPKVLIEQMTDASLPMAPAMQDTLNMLVLQDTNIIAVQIHWQDSLKTPASALYNQYFQLPNQSLFATLNRNYIVQDGRNYFSSNELRPKIKMMQMNVTPCKIYFSNLSVDTIFRNIQVDVNVQFYEDTKGDYRLGLYLMENNVCGDAADTTINGYNQLSAYYFTPYSAYYQMGYYSPVADAFVLNAYQYKHRYVLNQAVTSVLGDASVIPSVTDNSVTYTKTYTLSVPTPTNNVFRYNFRNMYLLAFVYEHDTLLENRRILNATKYKLLPYSEILDVPTLKDHSFFSIYPNPAADEVYIQTHWLEAEGEIFNIMGQKMMVFKGNKIEIKNLPNGLYIVKIQHQGKVFQYKLLIQK
ncbi:MAG: T9SS C-terminal target domain-containing protein [Bacteroidetes bacterium]|nr:MAG: T9SS C-terminal target domain-containing protein [Bacteroidota bacterium]